jgi:hypothetical protein
MNVNPFIDYIIIKTTEPFHQHKIKTKMKKIIVLLIAVTASYATIAQSCCSGMAVAKKDTVQSAKYTCPMHPEVTSDKPGKCPKCGMDLVKTKMYSCPMHPEVVSSKPGKCPKCGMDLTEVKSDAKTKKE